MKKAGLLLILIVLLSINTAALKIVNTKATGTNPVIYGSTAAFETSENDINKDLNNDGDQADRVIQYYDIDSGELLSTGMAGQNPSIFAYHIAFDSSERAQGADLNGDDDTNDNIIVYYNLRDQKTISTTAEGKKPSIFSDFIAFSTPESVMEVDYNNDGDQQDEVIKLYKISTKELTNTKAAGTNPAVSNKHILFETSEKDENKDLDKDDDKEDIVLRYYVMESGKTLSTFIPGQRPKMNAESTAAFTAYDNGETIYYYKVPTEELTKTELKGKEPSITNNLIAFAQNNKLAVYDTDKGTFAVTDIYGDNPSIFENKLVFSTNEALTGDLNNDGDTSDSIIRIAIGEDLDKDGVFDFADNCPETANEDQKDKDRDGEGDACDKDTKEEEKKEETVPAEAKATTTLEAQAEKTSEPKPLPQPKSFTIAKKKGPGFLTWFLIILAILAGIGCIVYAAVFGLGKGKKKFKF